LPENMPSARILPARTCGISELGTSTSTWMSPAMSAVARGRCPCRARAPCRGRRGLLEELGGEVRRRADAARCRTRSCPDSRARSR
jgi:hypothetical protein